MIESMADGSWHVRPFLAVTAGILVLFVGKWLNQRVALLREYNIPEPMTGGLLFSVAFTVLYLASWIKLAFEPTARDVLLVCFFVTIGLNARFADLKKGGRPLLILLAATLFFAVLVVFPLLRRNHDAAVISSGFVGLALGATPTAMASMTAVTQRHGASHVAFIVVPLFGAFLIDLISAVCVRLFLAFF